MSIFRDKYKLGDADFFNIRNRNEIRIIKIMAEFLKKKGGPLISDKDLQDIYALALNTLPPRYAQRGTIVLRDPVHKRDILGALEDAYEQVVDLPKP